ncbi:MAG: hypothetical protein KBD16_00395 [Candidatus Pacebacteria bacterium]|nr:hypothetical protein [Candidatus Paceibacterota bacterium]
MKPEIVFPVTAGAFLHDIVQIGATAVRIMSRSDAQALAEEVATYQFVPRTTAYGPRSVHQNFAACEEERVPHESPVRGVSKAIGETLMRMFAHDFSESAAGRMFKYPLSFNDHLLLRFPQDDGALDVHRDHSKYKNLIVSLTLSGRASFSIHDAPGVPAGTTFDVGAGMAVFMRAPGFLGDDERPYHSVSSVREERIALIMKQKLEGDNA